MSDCVLMELACSLQVLLFPAMKPEEKPQGGALKPQVWQHSV